MDNSHTYRHENSKHSKATLGIWDLVDKGEKRGRSMRLQKWEWVIYYGRILRFPFWSRLLYESFGQERGKVQRIFWGLFLFPLLSFPCTPKHWFQPLFTVLAVEGAAHWPLWESTLALGARSTNDLNLRPALRDFLGPYSLKVHPNDEPKTLLQFKTALPFITVLYCIIPGSRI